uniref:Uncharacterized protein n=1 Tax=Octactis speculum TaxID=3111310 RepID=A0A7S2H5B8_9STRA
MNSACHLSVSLVNDYSQVVVHDLSWIGLSWLTSMYYKCIIYFWNSGCKSLKTSTGWRTEQSYGPCPLPTVLPAAAAAASCSAWTSLLITLPKAATLAAVLSVCVCCFRCAHSRAVFWPVPPQLLVVGVAPS